jgi:hypothetical protein
MNAFGVWPSLKRHSARAGTVDTASAATAQSKRFVISVRFFLARDAGVRNNR